LRADRLGIRRLDGRCVGRPCTRQVLCGESAHDRRDDAGAVRVRMCRGAVAAPQTFWSLASPLRYAKVSPGCGRIALGFGALTVDALDDAGAVRVRMCRGAVAAPQPPHGGARAASRSRRRPRGRERPPEAARASTHAVVPVRTPRRSKMMSGIVCVLMTDETTQEPYACGCAGAPLPRRSLLTAGLALPRRHGPVRTRSFRCGHRGAAR
jgi:hypothetical protein